MANPKAEKANRKLCVVCAQIFPSFLSNCPDDGTPLMVADAAEAKASAEAPSGSTAKAMVGQVLGSYRLLRLLGEGGVGCVYEAEHVRLGRKMAIKLLHPQMAAETDVVMRFFNEARVVNEIRHPNIVDIEDFVQSGNRVYLLMELLEGRDLSTVLDDEGALDPMRVVMIGTQVADALARVHDKSVIHRDLKPDNLFLTTKDGEPDFVKVLDFGIAKFSLEDKVVTRAGLTMGTPEYMAPEQIRAQKLDGRTDVYALGVILYEALTDHRPFEDADYVKILKMHCGEPVMPPSQRRGDPLPPALEAVVMRCLEKNPEHRYASMDELREALLACRPGGAPRALSTTGMVKRPPPPRGRVRQLVPPLLMALAGGALVLASDLRVPTAQSRAAAPPAPAVAPAPQPAPTPPPAPAPAEVSVALVSRPPAAEVFLGVERKPIGRTPQTLKVPMSSESLLLTARFDDGTELQESVIPDRDVPPVVFVHLPPAPVAAPAPEPRPPRSRRTEKAKTTGATVTPPSPGGNAADREGVVDPFGGP
jgi:eukaryotic-like serine/threonine-protein kinase